LKSEIEILKEGQCEQVVSFYGAYQQEDELWLAMEYCSGGSVIDLINITGHELTEREIASICYPVLKAIDFLHSTKKIHWDIKAGNILLDHQGNAKLGDFGVSARLA